MRKTGWMDCVFVLAIFAAALHTVRAADAIHGSDANELKRVRVSVTCVDVAADVYAKAAKNAPSGADHDALLLAALVKAGAHPEELPELTTVDGVAGHVQTSSDFHYQTSDGKHQILTVRNGLEGTPKVNPDGSITSVLKIHREVLVVSATSPSPTITTNEMTTTSTLRDGETRVLAGWAPAINSEAVMHLMFLKMGSVAGKAQ